MRLRTKTKNILDRAKLFMGKTWEQVKVKHGEAPGKMKSYQFFTFETKLFNIGGSVNGYTTGICFAFHLLTDEVEQITSLDQPRDWHTIYYLYK